LVLHAGGVADERGDLVERAAGIRVDVIAEPDNEGVVEQHLVLADR